MGHLGRIVINAIAIAVAAYFIPGITYGTQHLYGLGDADRGSRSRSRRWCSAS